MSAWIPSWALVKDFSVQQGCLHSIWWKKVEKALFWSAQARLFCTKLAAQVANFVTVQKRLLFSGRSLLKRLNKPSKWHTYSR